MDGWIVTACRPSGLGPRWARVSARLAASLETTHRRVFEVSARRTLIGDEELTSDVPDAEVDHLDAATGLAREGTPVKPGTILAGKVTPTPPPRRTPEDALLDKIFGETPPTVRDTSLRAPPGLRGVVIAARREAPAEPGEVARAWVAVEWRRPLAVGDVLAIEGHGEVVVCAIDPSIDGLEADGPEGTVRVEKRAVAEDAMHARSIGPYSLVTQQPLVDRKHWGAQRIEERHLRALVGAGAACVAAECLTIKSDDILGRVRTFESLAQGEPVRVHASAGAAPLAPIEAAKVLRAEALALGFDLAWDERGARARWLGPDEIRARSFGEVKSHESIDDRTWLPVPDGLRCARIFGPIRDDECLCRKYRGTRKRGTVCEECGVEVTASKVRRERFGHVTLAVPVLHPWLVEPIALLLDLSEAEVRERGGRGVRALLEALDVAALANEGSPRGQLARALVAAGLSPSDLVVTVVPVLPADLRPLVPLEDNRFATSHLNDLYALLVDQNDRTQRVIQLGARPDVVDREARRLEEVYAQLLQNSYLREKGTGPDGQPLRCIASAFATRGAQNLLGKRVDYSGAAHLVVDSALADGECRIPRAMALELFKPHLYAALVSAGHALNVKVAKRLVEAALDALYGMRDASAPPGDDPLDRRVDELEMSIATANALQRAGITTIRELAARTEAELLQSGHFGGKSLRELSAILADLGLRFGMAPDEPARVPPGPERTLAVLDGIATGHPVLLAGSDRLLARAATLWDHPAVAVSPRAASLLGDRAIAVHVPLSEEAKAECARLPDIAAPVERAASGWLSAILYGTAGPDTLAKAAMAGEVDPLTDPVARLALGLLPAPPA